VTVSQEPVDLLCVGAHTDDAEVGCGGTLRLLADRGRSVWVCDLTRGELASNASTDERWSEAARASEILGLAGRIQLTLPDGFLAEADPAQTRAVTAVLRWLRPRWVVCAPDPRRHPDHLVTPSLVARAVFLAGLAALTVDPPPLRSWPTAIDCAGNTSWRCEALFEVCPVDQPPALIFDCSETWAAKLEALDCYRSQFARDPGRRPTRINDPEWLEEVERRGRTWGARAGVRYGEAFRSRSVPVLTDLPPERWS